MVLFAALHMSLPGTLLPKADAAECPQLAKADAVPCTPWSTE